ncbi:MAG: helix-turn-helix transcriptional regulator [Eggerthellaceae bacterium]|nr:helix-turn-helix transcriptional regulator [Eggerthellaceae bacterium]
MAKLSTIHALLAQTRKERGISQLTVAEALNLDQTTISLYENGHRGIPLPTLDSWFDLLGIDLSITVRGHEPVKAADLAERDLKEFEHLKRRRNYLIAEMRSMMAQRVMGDAFFAQSDPDSGEGRFWPVAFHDDNSIRLVEHRTDHPSQKHLAVEFTGEEVNVYRFAHGGPVRTRGIDRAYMTEDDFLTHGAVLSHDEMDVMKSTIFRANAAKPDGVELVGHEGFPVSSLLDMQEAHKRFEAVYDEVIALEGWQELEEELLGIEGRLDELLIDNRLENGMSDPAFTRWGEEDESAVSVPLHETERTWHWVEEGSKWVDDCAGEVGYRLRVDPEVHEEYETLREEDGSRVIGAIGPDKASAVFKMSTAKPGLIHRVEVSLDDLTDEESKRYDRIIEAAHELDELRNKEE